MSFFSKSLTELNTPRAMISRWILANHNSTWLSQEEYIGGKMHMDIGMVGQKVVHRVGFVCRQIVRDHVNLFFARLAGHEVGQEGDKLGTGMAPGGFPQHRPGPSIESGIERERTVAKVLETVAFGSPRRKWQDRIFAVQRLNRRFLIYREYRRVLRRIQVQPDNVSRLALKIRIGACHVTFKAMRFDAVPGPHSGHAHVRDIAQFQRQLAAAPVSGAIRWLSLCR